MTCMSPALLKQLCRENQLYSTPELNDKIYLHYKGFSLISNLSPYTGLKVIYLEGNSLVDVSGLEAQQELKCLYVQENHIKNIAHLQTPQLCTLNLNQNEIESLEGIERCVDLSTVLLQSNKLSDMGVLKPLLHLNKLSVLDISKNKFDDEAILDFLVQLPSLRVLYLKDNPFVERVEQYRKRVLSRLPQLKYLDDKPVFDDERRCVDAWSKGGGQAEKEERKKIEQEKMDKSERNFRQFEEMLEDARREKTADEKQIQLLNQQDDGEHTACEVPPLLDADGDADSDAEQQRVSASAGASVSSPSPASVSSVALAAAPAAPVSRIDVIEHKTRNQYNQQPANNKKVLITELD